MHDLILGTAGHIDHGKTSLVKALTGVDTDRLPEEKKRGITIELGFAELVLGECRLGIVDVPGHERFVRNMLAGATGIDLALLVVAADDSVKPQTREHLEILKLLGIEHGVIALTKCDLPERDWMELVEQEVRGLVADCPLATAKIVRTSARMGEGLDELRAALTQAAEHAAASPRRHVAGPFRLPIDRTFAIAGHGTVVTGSVSSGSVRVGDELVIEPGGIQVRVRGLQNHDRIVDEVHRGQRAALNLAGVHHDQIGRGQELASPGHLVPSRLISVRMRLVESATRPLKNRSRVRLHIGTAELAASVVLLDRDRLEPGEWALAQLFLGGPVAVTWGQAFVVRNESPPSTIGGGTVLDSCASKLRRREPRVLAQLAELSSPDATARASAAVYFAGFRDCFPVQLARTAGLDNGGVTAQALIASGELMPLAVSPRRTLQVHRLVLADLEQRIESALVKLHARFPLQTAVERTQLAQRFKHLCSDDVLDVVLNRMQLSGRLRLGPRTVALTGHGPQLSANEQKLLDRIVEIYAAAGYQPPTIAEVQAQVTRNQAVVPQLVALAATDRQLVQVSAELYLHAEVEQRLRKLLGERLAAEVALTVSQIREILGVSRKYAVPICEYLDRIGFTRRTGDVRVLVVREQA